MPMAKLHDNLKELGKQGALLFIGTNVEHLRLQATICRVKKA